MNGNSTNSASADVPDLSRVLFFDGQRLEANDLNSAAIVQRELRWLHNRSLHSWGIGLGFAVAGKKGDRQVTIAPGYAIDCRGREIILTDNMVKAVPARSGDSSGKPVIFYLVAAYPDDSKLEVLERREGECGGDGAVRMQERADIYWKEGGEQVETGIEIVLAQAKVQDCQLASPLSVEQRRAARPPQQPYVAAGQVGGITTGWKLWKVSAPEERILGVQLEVDTTAGRFSSAPQYQGQLQGERLITNSGLSDYPTFLMDGTLFLREPTRLGFTACVHMPSVASLGGVPLNPAPLFANDGALLLDFVAANWSLIWMGVEG